ncbi:MAG: MaoC family dehydratase [Chloroflexota bacterium]
MDKTTFETLHGYYLEELSVGMEAVYTKTFTEADVLLFRAVSGDTNPLHTNEAFAAQTRFGKRILHGMLTTSLWSTIVGTLLPGPGCVYMGQTLNFYKPVYVGDTVSAKMTIVKIDTTKQRAYLHAKAFVEDELVAEGEAKVWVPRAK